MSGSRTTTAAPERDRLKRRRSPPPGPPEPAEPTRERGGPRGHAFYAAEARAALGIAPWISATHLPDVPAPAFQGVVALLTSGLVVLVRPQAVGVVAAGILDAALMALCCTAILFHARLVGRAGFRPGVEITALPAATLVALQITVAGTAWVVAGAVAVALTAAVIVLVPHLDALRSSGRDELGIRLGLDIAGILASVPFALVGASSAGWWSGRALLVGAGCGAICYDALRVEVGRGRRAVAGAVAVAVVIAVLTPAASRTVTQAAGATALLLLWYGLRGLGTTVLPGHPARAPVVEYSAFCLAAVATLVFGMPGR